MCQVRLPFSVASAVAASRVYKLSKWGIQREEIRTFIYILVQGSSLFSQWGWGELIISRLNLFCTFDIVAFSSNLYDPFSTLMSQISYSRTAYFPRWRRILRNFCYWLVAKVYSGQNLGLVEPKLLDHCTAHLINYRVQRNVINLLCAFLDEGYRRHAFDEDLSDDED